MKKMTKSLVMASSILFVGANAYAAKVIPGNYSHASRFEVIETTAVDTKDKAYSIGFKKLNDLKKLGVGKKLSEELGLFRLSAKEKRSTNLESGYVTVQEFMNEDGKIITFL
jgi:hypothetical protein